MKGSSHVLAFAAVTAFMALLQTPVQAQAQEKASGSYGADAAAVKKGRNLFQARGCFGCHTVGKGKLAGPDLAGVLERREPTWVHNWLSKPDEMMGSDPIAQELVKEYKNVKMPNLKLKDEEVEALMHYLAAETQRVKK